jgi:hypothetical protein
MGKKPAGFEFSEDIALAVCAHISFGLSLRKIEAIEGMPTKSAVMMWLLQGEALKAAGDVKNPKALFLDQYARAREVQADSLADDIITIADESQYDSFVDANGKTVVNMEHIQCDRLRGDACKWMANCFGKWVAGKLRPQKYGDKVDATVVGDPNKLVAYRLD